MKDKIISLIEDNAEIFIDDSWGYPADILRIKDAEKTLGLSIPESYIWFLQKWGGLCETGILGCGKNGEILCVDATERERKMGLPQNMILIRDCDEYVDCIDSETGKIVSWSAHDNDGLIEKFCDFYTYLIDELENAIDNY